MEQEPRPITHDDLHATYVGRSLKELQQIVQDQEEVLTTLRRTTPPVPRTAAASLAIMKAGFDAATQDAEPFLPFPDSVLPALLALRRTHQIVAESRACTAETQGPALEHARQQLARERAARDDQRALQAALEARVAALRTERESESESESQQAQSTTAAQRRKAKAEALRAEQRRYDADTTALLKALRGFIQEQLGGMLAAEALGGPVVGGLVDVQAADLAAGFSAQGKLKKPRTEGPDKRQRRLDEMWGGEADEDGSNNSSEAAAAAAADMQELTEQLLNALADAQGDSSAAYVTIPQESAAARFLVRSKVAQFHPRDAARLRLIDFGRELEA